MELRIWDEDALTKMKIQIEDYVYYAKIELLAIQRRSG